jgi:hypothetical protein
MYELNYYCHSHEDRNPGKESMIVFLNQTLRDEGFCCMKYVFILLAISFLTCSPTSDSTSGNYSGDWIDRDMVDSIEHRPIHCRATVDQADSYFQATVTNDSTKEIITIQGRYESSYDDMDFFLVDHFSSIPHSDSTDSGHDDLIMNKDRSAFSYTFERERYTRLISVLLKKN